MNTDLKLRALLLAVIAFPTLWAGTAHAGDPIDTEICLLNDGLAYVRIDATEARAETFADATLERVLRGLGLWPAPENVMETIRDC